MTRKTTAYARKRRLPPGHVIQAGHSWISALERCRVFTDEPVIPGMQGTLVNATSARLQVREALDKLLTHRVQPDDPEPHDLLAHAVDVAHIRATEIDPSGTAPAHQHLLAGKAALFTMRQRFNRLGKWGLNGTERAALAIAVEHYEDILENSAPEQMQAAVDLRLENIKRGKFYTESPAA